jgi:hypothetical protein
MHEASYCHGTLKFTDSRGRVFVRVGLWSLDVWGNSKDGFEVNDRSRRPETLFLPDDADEKTVVKALKAKELLNKRSRNSSFSVEWHDNRHGDVNWSKTGEPLFQLEVL